MPDSGSLNTIEILGVKIHNITLQQALESIDSFVKSKKSNLIVTLGTEMVMESQKDSIFRRLINSASLVLPDGGGLIWASRRLGTPLQKKVAGIDLLLSVCERSPQKRWKIFFLGGRPGVAELAERNIRAKFPDANIVGTYHGYFTPSEILPVLQSAKPDILFAGMGSPRQEFWLKENLEQLKIPVGAGVGGSFDVLAGKLRRSPAWMIGLNLEWFFRFFQEPRRFRRILKIPLFMLYIYLNLAQKKKTAVNRKGL